MLFIPGGGRFTTTASACPPLAAPMRGVWPSRVGASTFAPPSSSALRAPMCPPKAASMSAVRPSAALASTMAPAASSFLIAAYHVVYQ
eukprot:685835-Prorocentrum_minimum.AAC.1